MANLLQGIRVIENASVITGPLAGMILADLGADVLKIENPDGGDQFRKWDATEDRVNLSFAVYNRGKRSMTLNLRSDQGRDVYRRLVRDADVVIENYRPGAMDGRGIGYAALSELNPALVYCEITGLGGSGPYRDRPTFDAVAQAMSGLWSTFIDVDHPEAIGPPMSDQLTGIYGACAILSALVARGTSGLGTKVAVNMLSSSMSFISGSFAAHIVNAAHGEVRVPSKTARARSSQSYAFVAKGGKPFAVHLSTPKKFWEGLCRTVGLPEMANDDRYNTKGKRIQRYEEIYDCLAPIFATGERDTWLEALIAEDVPCAPILTPGETLEDPQVQHLNMLWEDPASGYQLVRSPIQHEGQFAAGTLPAPGLGEHSIDVLQSLGYSQAEVEGFKGTGVF